MFESEFDDLTFWITDVLIVQLFRMDILGVFGDFSAVFGREWQILRDFD